jgi:predicted kinase
MEAVILVGIQGSGKTTFYGERFSETHVRISLDDLRTRERERALVRECFKDRRPFVVDKTNVLASERAIYIAAAKAAGFRVMAYHFRVPLRAAIARNNRRQPGEIIPIPALIATLKRLQPPTLDEGFDQIFIVELAADNRFLVTPQSGPD